MTNIFYNFNLYNYKKMSIFIDTSRITTERNDVNFIPCSIDYNGRANVSTYFKENPELNQNISTSFRGRPLIGSEIELPNNYVGYVLRKPDKDNFPQTFVIQQSFTKMKYWNLDRAPSKNDVILSTFDWLDISKDIHRKESISVGQNNDFIDK